MNKIFKVLVGVATLTLGVALLTACNTEKDSNLAVAQVYSFSTVSGAQLNRMSEATLEAEPEVEPETDPITEPETDPIIEDDMDDVNHYVNLLESFISNPIKVSDPVASDLVDDEGNPLYQWMVTYEVVNALGEKDIYEFHYTEEVIYDSTLVVTDDNDDDELDVEDDDDDELETEDIEVEDNETVVITKLTGIMVVGEETFEVSGRTVVETEDDETEIKTTFITKRNEDSFVIVKYEKEIEEGETEEKFFVSEHNRGLVRHTIIEIEQEDNEYSFKLQYRDRTTGEFKKIKVESSDDENYDFVISFIEQTSEERLMGKILVDVMIDEVTGEASYEYEVVNLREQGRHHGQGMKYRGNRYCDND